MLQYQWKLCTGCSTMESQPEGTVIGSVYQLIRKMLHLGYGKLETKCNRKAKRMIYNTLKNISVYLMTTFEMHLLYKTHMLIDETLQQNILP